MHHFRARSSRRRLLLALGAAALPGLIGCAWNRETASAVYPTAAASGERSLMRERAALRRVLAAEATPARAASLRRAALDPYLPQPDRGRALAALLAQDESAAKKTVQRLLAGLPPGDWVDELGRLAARRGWMSCAEPLAWRAYRLHDPLDMSPSRDVAATLAALTQLLEAETPAGALWRLVSDTKRRPAARAGAWELLVHFTSLDEARQRVLAEPAPPQPGLIADLRRCASELHTVPATLDEIMLLRTVLQAEQGSGMETMPLIDPTAWSRWRDLATHLTDEQRQGLLLRHFPVFEAIARCRPDLLRLTRGDLLAHLRAELAETGTISPRAGGMVAADVPADLGHWADQLPLGDLLLLGLLIDEMHEPRFQSAVARQVESDLADGEREWGGLVLHDEPSMPPSGSGCLVLQSHTSAGPSLGDIAFTPPEAMRLRGYTAVATYHLHAQQRDSSANAGPGRGDLRFAARSGSACLLVTPCGARGHNLDYFARLPSGRVAVIDLGTIPAARP